MLAPARSARGGQGQRLAPGAGTQIDDPLTIRRRAAERDQLAAFVLDLDVAVEESRMLVDATVGGQANAPWAERRRDCAREGIEHRLAASSRNIDAQVERRPLEQGGPFVGGDQRRQLACEPWREQPRRRARLAVADRPRAMRRAVEQSREFGVVAGQPDHRRAAVRRRLARPADGAEHQLPHRPPVLRPGIAAGLEKMADDRIGRRPILARRTNAQVENLDCRLDPG